MLTQRERVEQAALFLRELGRGIPENERVMVGYASEATVQTDADGKKMNAGWWPVPWLEDKYINGSANCYACISSSIKTENPKTGELRYWRGEASFGHGLALMVDDIGYGAGAKGQLEIADLSCQLQPTAIVQTSPGNFQLWYFLREPCAQMRYFKTFLISFVNSVLSERGGDSTIRDVSRYGRMPCGVNNKRLSDGTLKYGHEYCVSLYEADYARRYSIEEIAEAFGFKVEMPVVVSYSERDDMDAVYLKLAIEVCSAAKMGEGPGGKVEMNQSGKYRIKCPWGDEHSNGDPFGAHFRGPVPGAEYDYVFGCSHDTCRRLHRRTWSIFVDQFIMPYVEGELNDANEQAIEMMKRK